MTDSDVLQHLLASSIRSHLGQIAAHFHDDVALTLVIRNKTQDRKGFILADSHAEEQLALWVLANTDIPRDYLEK